MVTSRQNALSGSICNNPNYELPRCPYRQQNILNTVEQREDTTHNYMYHIDESQNNIDQKKLNSRENILCHSIVQKWAKLMVSLKAVWPYVWAAVTRRGKSGFWKLVMSGSSTWMLVTEGVVFSFKAGAKLPCFFLAWIPWVHESWLAVTSLDPHP